MTQNQKVTIHHDDCLTALRAMPDASVSAIVTDPPYGLSNTDPASVADTITKWAAGDREHVPTGRGFMGKAWDAFVPPPAVWDECLRVLKPGGHMVVFAGSRTQDLMGLSIRLAGFDIRDSVAWLYGSGFSKAGLLGNKKELTWCECDGVFRGRAECPRCGGIDPAYRGFSPALKPAHEPVIVARKPLEGTVAGNVLEHGTGALNIGASRIGGSSGRWPANVVLDESQAVELDRQSGTLTSGKPGTRRRAHSTTSMAGTLGELGRTETGYGDAGGASRFFYTAKASRVERPVSYQKPCNCSTDVVDPATSHEWSETSVCGGCGKPARKVQHETVKPLAIMRWLIRLTTPPGGLVLDPFAGSGTTIEAAILEGFPVIGVEREADYLPLIQARIDRAGAAGPEPEPSLFDGLTA